MYINGEGGGIVLESPASAEAHDCFNRYAVEEADEVIVDGGKMDVGWCVVEVSMEVLPKVGYGKLSWMLR